MTELHDSGERQSFDTGAVRDTATGKPRPALISPFFTERLAAHLAAGAAKYCDRNWEKGIPITRCLDSLERHLIAFKKRECGEDHLAAAACNIMFITHFDSLGVMDDRPRYEQEPEHRPPITAPLEGTIEELDWGFKPRICDLDPEDMKSALQARGEPLKIYVAGPYTHGVTQVNVEKAKGMSLVLAEMGHYVHCPHAATEHLDGALPYEWFMELDFSIIRDWATALFRIEGHSPGADREEEVAKEKGIPIFRDVSEVPNLVHQATKRYKGISSTR